MSMLKKTALSKRIHYGSCFEKFTKKKKSTALEDN